ncbi:MAG TPA: OadG family transporter subunit [Dehalococcoidales bacterium]|nr:OadG family transporter subunit [Dehalococcoidales bacterium]
MAVDWGFAAQIGGIGFGMVFILLIILAIAIWLVGRVFGKINTGGSDTGDKRKGD